MFRRFFILAGGLAGVFAGLAVPAMAEGVHWVDPWAPHAVYPELAGGPAEATSGYRENGVVWIDPFADERCDCTPEEAGATGSISLAGFNGGVGNRQSVVVIQNGFYFNPSLPAGQAAMTGARAAPVHPLGRPRF